MLTDVLFDTLKKQQPNFAKKITPVRGDVSLSDLGLSPDDRSLLVENVDVVVHSAATVRFDEKIKSAVHINIRGTKAMLELAMEFKRLASFVHISTAFSNCDKEEIREEFYKPPMSAEQILELVEKLPDHKIDAMTPQ